MSAIPNLENFDSRELAREIRAFLKKHNISTRDWVKLSGGSYDNLKRMEQGNDMLVSRVARYQQVMRTYKAIDA